jgi:acyl carrier protein
MMAVDWDGRYVEMILENLPEHPDSTALAPDTNLAAVGLDSIRLIRLVIALEAEYDIAFSDDRMTPDTFATPTTLWDALRELRTAS